MDAFLGVLFMVAFLFGLLLAYKNRSAVAKWLNDPTMAASYDPKMRRRYLERKIEDAELELEKLDEIEKK